MRPTNFNRVNWIILSLIALYLSFLYFIVSHSEISSLETSSRGIFSNLYLRQNNSNSTYVTNFNRNKNSDHYYHNEQQYKTDKYGELWRSLGNNIDEFNSSGDKVLDLMKWMEDFSKSEYFKTAKPKRVLAFDGFDSYYSTDGKLKCPFNDTALLSEKCIIKEDRLLGVTNYAEFDTFVSVRNWKHPIYDRKIPLVNHIFYIQESPFVARYADLSLNNVILASYWRGSDIVLPYGYFSRFTEKDKPEAQHKSINYAEGKSKLVAIVVSNCNARNDRQRYVKELKKYIPVHDYGSCGPYRCDNCFELVRKEYKFYLAFENANCRDYMTEKFWSNALNSNSVPVVMGAHPEDYKALAPPKSYIHVEDFKSPKDLADYLLLLDKNDILYNEYFHWKRLGRINKIWPSFFCRVCAILFYADFNPQPTWATGSTWGSVNRCLPSNKWYWTRTDP